MKKKTKSRSTTGRGRVPRPSSKQKSERTYELLEVVKDALGDGEKKYRCLRSDGKTVMLTVSRYRALKREGRASKRKTTENAPDAQGSSKRRRREKKPVEFVRRTDGIDCPSGLLSIFSGSDRVLPLALLSDDGQDVLCYHARLGTTMHLQRSALYGKSFSDVDEALQSIQQWGNNK